MQGGLAKGTEFWQKYSVQCTLTHHQWTHLFVITSSLTQLLLANFVAFINLMTRTWVLACAFGLLNTTEIAIFFLPELLSASSTACYYEKKIQLSSWHYILETENYSTPGRHNDWCVFVSFNYSVCVLHSWKKLLQLTSLQLVFPISPKANTKTTEEEAMLRSDWCHRVSVDVSLS